MQYFFLALTGFLGGVTGGLFGVGGGVIFVSCMIIFLKLTPHQAVATSLASIVPAALLAAYKHAHAGNTVWKIVPWLIVFALAGSWVGSGLSIGMDASLLRRLFACFLLLVAVKLFFSN